MGKTRQAWTCGKVKRGAEGCGLVWRGGNKKSATRRSGGARQCSVTLQGQSRVQREAQRMCEAHGWCARNSGMREAQRMRESQRDARANAPHLIVVYSNVGAIDDKPACPLKGRGLLVADHAVAAHKVGQAKGEVCKAGERALEKGKVKGSGGVRVRGMPWQTMNRSCRRTTASFACAALSRLPSPLQRLSSDRMFRASPPMVSS